MSAPKLPATIRKAAEGEGKFIRHSGARDHYGHVILTLEPRKRGTGIEICNMTCNNIPAEFINPIVEAIAETFEVGIGNYAPIIDVTVRIVGGSSTSNRFKRTSLQVGCHHCRERRSGKSRSNSS